MFNFCWPTFVQCEEKVETIFVGLKFHDCHAAVEIILSINELLYYSDFGFEHVEFGEACMATDSVNLVPEPCPEGKTYQHSHG